LIDCAVLETVVFLDYFKGMPDPRMRGKVDYPLDEILLLCLVAVIGGAEGAASIARYGELKLNFLRRFRPFANGTPSHDQIGDVLASLDPEAFRCCFTAWVSALIDAPVDAIALDGKTLCGTKKMGRTAHIVSAFAARERLVLGQVKVGEKTNEITAIPRLLDMIDVAGAVVTIDAMGCQREIATKILEKNANYLLALKGNQSRLHDDVRMFVDEQKKLGYADTTASRHETLDGDHGRIETRVCTVVHDVDWLVERHEWPGLKGIVVVDSTVETGGKTVKETRLYITSSALGADRLGAYVRGHWSIENV
jgi:predicted transposase YbfD/YdcC